MTEKVQLTAKATDAKIQSRVAKLVAYVWLAITPFKIAIGLKVRGVLESSHH